MASIFVRTDGEATSDEKTSKERMHLDLEADDVELKSAASRRSVPPGGITRQNAGAVGVGGGVSVRGSPGETSRHMGTGALTCGRSSHRGGPRDCPVRGG